MFLTRWSGIASETISTRSVLSWLYGPQIEKLMVQELKAYATSLREHKKVAMVWDKDVLDFLVRQVGEVPY